MLRTMQCVLTMVHVCRCTCLRFHNFTCGHIRIMQNMPEVRARQHSISQWAYDVRKIRIVHSMCIMHRTHVSERVSSCLHIHRNCCTISNPIYFPICFWHRYTNLLLSMYTMYSLCVRDWDRDRNSQMRIASITCKEPIGTFVSFSPVCLYIIQPSTKVTHTYTHTHTHTQSHTITHNHKQAK